MNTPGKRRSPLVAERRQSQGAAPSGPRKRPAKPRKAAPRGGPIRRFFGGIFRWIWRLVWGVTWRISAVVAVIVGLATFYFWSTMPDVTEMLDGRARGSVTLMDDAGEVFAWRGESFGGTITAETVSPHLRNAIVATEDRRFYQHLGVSPRGIIGAMRVNLSEGRGALSGHGGSTITQQVAKLLCLGVPFDPNEWQSEADYEAECRRGSVWRKLKEVPYAFALEWKYTKNEILTIYMNRAFLGAGSRGFEAAAQRYFGRSANQVTPPEAAMLAGLLVAPSYYAPTRNLQRAQDRAAVVIGLMAEQDYLTETELAEARAYPATLSSAAEQESGGYFADWIMATGPSYLTRETTEDVLIETTLDPRIQKAAEDAMQTVFENQVREGSNAEAAIVIMSADGAVRGMVGGRENVVGGFNRATQAMRQAGSAFKPFLFAAALENGFEPFDIVEDAPLTIDIPGSGPWTPRNYTNDFIGMITLTEALAQSRNIPAVKVSEAMGREEVRRVANEFGIRSELAEGPALALGSSESSLLDMTAAYAGILNGGSAVRPYGLRSLRLIGSDAPLMGRAGGIGERVISEDSAQKLIWMMTQVVENGTGRRARMPGWEVAGKTGTTQASRDAWFLGFTADYVAGVWMGYDDNSPLTGVTGGGLPAEIWREAMTRVVEGRSPQPLPMIEPQRPRLDPPALSGPVASQSGGENAIERAVRDVLGGIFGGN
ncbi:transglycosylase domain-containing protein [Roseicitreum antarcticum]|uniref:peptidoglycan glycosyltransferase n=1 Tax=Roseicitreum antarcticum TaxID=564137 RepID=A0A1H3B1K2_9RHOB|nr:PBP1A family penicillin-binding protein [Roseicitreum antarcticum]SDX35531.1 penicillin-binding protein, 1A family [Roseicitreum antarcticum]